MGGDRRSVVLGTDAGYERREKNLRSMLFSLNGLFLGLGLLTFVVCVLGSER